MIEQTYAAWENPPLKIQAYFTAYTKLSQHDRDNLNKAMKRLMTIKKMGSQSAFELLSEISLTVANKNAPPA
jgi:hypothetical protein